MHLNFPKSRRDERQFRTMVGEAGRGPRFRMSHTRTGARFDVDTTDLQRSWRGAGIGDLEKRACTVTFIARCVVAHSVGVRSTTRRGMEKRHFSLSTRCNNLNNAS